MARICLKCRREYDLPEARACPEDGSPLHPVLDEYTGEPEAIEGRILDGRYRVEEILGSGGMGMVLRARHVFLERPAAIKLLHPELLVVREVRERFLREAQAASAVSHPHIIGITDFGVTHQGLHYLVMEYLDGADLLTILEERGSIPAPSAAIIGAQVCDALATVHAHGFVHRDLKPENLWLTGGAEQVERGDPDVRLLDFGIAGVLASNEQEQERLTRTGRTLGTPNYMAPEQARAVELDGRADLYALACVLWEAVIGEPLFAGDSPMDVMTRQLSEEPRRASDVNHRVPPGFDDALAPALAKKPDERYQDAEAMRRGLEAFRRARETEGDAGTAAGADAPAPRSDVDERVPATAEAPLGTSTAEPVAAARRPGKGVVGLAAALVASVAAFGIYVWSTGTPEEGASASASASREASASSASSSGRGEGSAAVSTASDAGSDARSRAAERDAAAHDAPDASTHVALKLHVEPEGTEVRRDGRTVGETPLTLRVARDASEHTYTFRHPGRRSLSLELSHGAARRLTQELPAAPDATSPGEGVAAAGDGGATEGPSGGEGDERASREESGPREGAEPEPRKEPSRAPAEEATDDRGGGHRGNEPSRGGSGTDEDDDDGEGGGSELMQPAIPVED